MGRYFSRAELCKSDTARKAGIDNTPPPSVSVKLDVLIARVLDPLRAWYGKPIRVSSGFRCGALNRAVGGAAGSQHLTGEAADITVGDRDGNEILFDYIRKNLEFDQLIDENNFQWVHVSFRAGHNRGEVLRYRGGVYTRL